jgi:hypothetical protein
MPTGRVFRSWWDAKAKLRGLIERLDARAAGCWEVVYHPRLAPAGILCLRAFVKTPDLSALVAQTFTQTCGSVEVEGDRLSIVRAALTGSVEVSRAETLPAGFGSGYWLRELGAARSVAVPFLDDTGRVAIVVSVAMSDAPPDDDAVARAVREVLDRPN